MSGNVPRRLVAEKTTWTVGRVRFERNASTGNSKGTFWELVPARAIQVNPTLLPCSTYTSSSFGNPRVAADFAELQFVILSVNFDTEEISEHPPRCTRLAHQFFLPKIFPDFPTLFLVDSALARSPRDRSGTNCSYRFGFLAVLRGEFWFQNWRRWFRDCE